MAVLEALLVHALLLAARTRAAGGVTWASWRLARDSERELPGLWKEWNASDPGPDAGHNREQLESIASKAFLIASRFRLLAAELSAWYQRPIRVRFLRLADEFDDLGEAAEISATPAVLKMLSDRLAEVEPVTSPSGASDWRRELANL